MANNRVEFYSAYPGMLLWYYTDQFSDNWVGVHPWQGMLQVVDAKPGRIPAKGTEFLSAAYGVSEGLPADVYANLADATFNTGFQIGQTLTNYYGLPATIKIPTGPRVALFDDRKTWVDRFWEPYLQWETGWWPASYTDIYGILTTSLNSTVTPTRGVKITAKPRAARYSGGMVIVDYSRPIAIR